MAYPEQQAQLATNNPNMQVQSTGPMAASVGSGWMSGSPAFPSILGSSMPSNAPVYFRSGMPGSMEEGQNVTFSQMAGTSGYQPQITTNGFYITHMPNGEHDQLHHGEYAWVFNAALKRGNPAMPTLKTFHINRLLRRNHNIALEAWIKALTTKQGIEGVAEYKDLEELSKLPTHAWRDSKIFQDITKQDHYIARAFSYLDLDTVATAWNLYGSFVGQMEGKDSPAFRVAALLRKGVGYEVVNIWGENLLPFHYVGFIIKRAQDPLSSAAAKRVGISAEVGPIQMIPWHGASERPSLSELHYTDITGHRHKGVYIGVGRVLWHVDPPRKGIPYRQAAGLTRESTNYDPSSPLRQRIRLSVQPRRGIKHNFFY